MEGLAEYYSAELAQKIQRGMNESALKCQSTGGTRVLGYYTDKDRHFQIDPDAAQIVQTIFDMYIKGEPNTAIADFLNERGFQTLQGGPFNKNIITRVVKNRKYMGEYRYGDIVILIPQLTLEEFMRRQSTKVKEKRRKTRVFKVF